MLPTPQSLALLPLFAELDANTLEELSETLEWFSLPGGWTLFKDGDQASALYIVTSGTLGIMRPDEDGLLRLHARVYAGETVGEMALVSNDHRSATVVALRDCTLLRLDQMTFEKLVDHHPDPMLKLARTLADRLRDHDLPLSRQVLGRTYAIVPLTEDVNTTRLARALASQLRQLSSTPDRIIVLGDDHMDDTEIELHTLETLNRHVIYYASKANSTWGKLIRRRADHILFAAVPDAPLVSASRISPVHTIDWRRRDLILFRKQIAHRIYKHSPQSREKVEWLTEAFNCGFSYQISLNSRDQRARLARLVTGRAVGAVLAGGGARGFAHIGVLAALKDHGIEIDLLAGTSMGAVIAACFAMGWDAEEVTERLADAFARNNPANDYTLPLVSLIRGHKIDRRLQRHFGDRRIEDLDIPFFCVSANLNTGKPSIHHSGLLWKAVRASISIPGIIPPVRFDDGVHIDGGVLDNLPTDIMAAMDRGPVIAIDVAQDYEKDFSARRKPRLAPLRRILGIDQDLPGITHILYRAATLSSNAQARESRQQAAVVFRPHLPDIGLLHWKALERSVALGHDYASTLIEEGALVPVEAALKERS